MASNYAPSSWMSDSMLQNLTSMGVAPDAIVSNLPRSGQLGTGIRFTKLDGATPAVFNPVVGVVLHTPRMWDVYPHLQEMLRSLMETHAKSITGIDFGYTLETQDTPVGHDGQTMKVPTRTTRGGVNPSATFPEYPGMPVYNIFKTWMFDIQHPDTNMSILPAQISKTSRIPAWYMTAYSMSMLFIQYDPSGIPDRIYDAIVITNMFPTEIGEIGFERSLGTTQLKERSISFSGIVQHNENTRELGYRVAEMLALHKINYNFALPGVAGTVDVSTSISKELLDMGGLTYEAHGTTNGAPEGSINQYAFQGAKGDAAYNDSWIAGTEEKKSQIPKSGSANGTDDGYKKGGSWSVTDDDADRFSNTTTRTHVVKGKREADGSVTTGVGGTSGGVAGN